MKLSYEVTRHHVRLRRGDMEALAGAYPTTGANFAIRRLVSQHVDELRRRGKVAPADIDLPKEPAA